MRANEQALIFERLLHCDSQSVSNKSFLGFSLRRAVMQTNVSHLRMAILPTEKIRFNTKLYIKKSIYLWNGKNNRLFLPFH
jgi:hypothetical protein